MLAAQGNHFSVTPEAQKVGSTRSVSFKVTTHSILSLPSRLTAIQARLPFRVKACLSRTSWVLSRENISLLAVQTAFSAFSVTWTMDTILLISPGMMVPWSMLSMFKLSRMGDRLWVMSNFMTVLVTIQIRCCVGGAMLVIRGWIVVNGCSRCKWTLSGETRRKEGAAFIAILDSISAFAGSPHDHDQIKEQTSKLVQRIAR